MVLTKNTSPFTVFCIALILIYEYSEYIVLLFITLHIWILVFFAEGQFWRVRCFLQHHTSGWAWQLPKEGDKPIFSWVRWTLIVRKTHPAIKQGNLHQSHKGSSRKPSYSFIKFKKSITVQLYCSTYKMGI